MLVKLFGKTNTSKIILLKALTFFLLSYFSCLHCDYFKADAAEITDSGKTGYDTVERNEDKSLKDEGVYDAHDIFYLLDEQTVSIASKREEKIHRAPSIVTVITEEEISHMGARRLTDILIAVPGIDIIKDASFGIIEIGSRGIRALEEKIKIFIDGHSVNFPLLGDAATFFDDLSLKNVKRIEIIRGPGSALYGANAFLAVINIITKSASDIDGLEITSGFGSFDTQEYSILYGKQLYGVDITGFIDFYNTNGLSDTIKEDSLSARPLFFNQFSIAPGDTDDSRNKLDLNLKLSYNDLKLNAKYMNKDTESFVGPAFVLTDDSENHYNYVMGELSYKLNIGDRITVKPRVYYDQYDVEFETELLPDGFVLPDLFDLDRDGDVERFPDGLFGVAKATNRRLGGEIQVDYEIWDNNTFTFGFDYQWERQDNIETSGNFHPKTLSSLGSVQGFPESLDWIRRVYRQIWAVYLQNKWDITNDIGLTIGIRHDHYSDFEGTTNPRIGLNWQFMDNATLKLLYGQAFRAPSFSELYTKNNPILRGNSDLEPETVRTYEVGLEYKFTEKLKTNINYFFNVVRDEIIESPKRRPLDRQDFDNLGGSNIQGIEFEVKADLGKNTYAFANYTYQDSETKGDPQPDIPKHKGNIGINFGLWKYFNANIHTFISGKRKRNQNDTRDDSPGYTIVNFTLTVKDFFNDMKLKASVFNLLDKDYNDPSIVNTIPTDLPRPGRSFFMGLEYKF